MLTLPGETLVICSGKRDFSALRDAGAEVLCCGSSEAVVDVNAVLEELAKREINDLLVEAGPRVAGHMIEQEIVDELVIYQAPHIMGSETSRMFQTPTWSSLADRRMLDISDITQVGKDTRITARVQY